MGIIIINNKNILGLVNKYIAGAISVPYKWLHRLTPVCTGYTGLHRLYRLTPICTGYTG